MKDKIELPSIVLLSRPVIKMSDYIKYQDWPRFSDPDDEVFIVPDKFWDKLPVLIERYKYGEDQAS